MADHWFSDWETLTAAVEKRVPAILTKDVAPVAEEILRKHIKSDIYDVYTPKENGWVHGSTYQRRHILEDSIVAYVNGDTLVVTSTATASPSVIYGWSFENRYAGAFLEMLETGNMGFWRKDFPRPAVSNAQKEIDKSDEITAAIQKGIIREIQ